MTKEKSLTEYIPLLDSIKGRIRRAQIRATLSANAEMLLLYWDVGRIVADRQKEEGWGAGVIPRLAADIKNDMPEVKGFSERNIKRMIQFYREYPLLLEGESTIDVDTSLKNSIRPRPVAQLSESSQSQSIRPQPVAKLATADEIRLEVLQQYAFLLPWGHHALLMEKAKDFSVRLWYMKESVEQNWTRDTLAAMIKKDTYNRQGKAVTNFAAKLPSPESELAQQLLRDPYIFDFLTLEEPFHEKELENALAGNLEKFLLELGHGFAFLGRQYRIEVSERDFYLDWNGEITPCIHQNHIFRVRGNIKIITPAYLSSLIGSQRGKRYFLKAAKQTTGIASINMRQLKAFPVLVPPYALQEGYDRYNSEVECQRESMYAALMESENLFSSLLQRAFRGEL